MLECTNPTLRELLHGYELNQLNDEDRDRFEEHLVCCPFCAAETQEMLAISTALIENRPAMLGALREDGLSFDQIRRRLTHKRETIWDKLAAFWGSFYGRTALAGALATVVLLAIFVRPTSSPYLGDLSYDLPPYQLDIRLRGESRDQAAVAFELAMESYQNYNYPAAVKGIQHALDLDANQPDRWLYLGVSQYATHNARAAVRSLKKADDLGTGLTKIRARWYLAQAYLYLGKAAPARALLEWLVAENGEHADDAHRLLTVIQEHEGRQQ